MRTVKTEKKVKIWGTTMKNWQNAQLQRTRRYVACRV